MQESSPEIRSQEGMHFQFDQELLQVLPSIYFQLIMVFNLTLVRLEPFFVSRISFRPTMVGHHPLSKEVNFSSPPNSH